MKTDKPKYIRKCRHCKQNMKFFSGMINTYFVCCGWSDFVLYYRGDGGDDNGQLFSKHLYIKRITEHNQR